jgi:hypothetical protein
MEIFMKQLLIAAYAVAIIAGVNVLFQTKAAAVNCSYDACIKQCSKDGATNSGCSNFCTKAMRDRKFAGQCK